MERMRGVEKQEASYLFVLSPISVLLGKETALPKGGHVASGSETQPIRASQVKATGLDE